MHPRPAGLLQRQSFTDDDLGHAGRAEVHRGVPLHHEHHVGEGGGVGATGGGRTEQAADLGDAAGEADLVVEDPAGAAPAGEQLDLVGDACPGRVDQPEDRQLSVEGCFGEAHDLLDGSRTPGPGFHRRVVGHHEHRPPADGAPSRDHAVRREIGRERVREESVFDQAAIVEQQGEPLTGVELACRAGPGRPRRVPAAQGCGRPWRQASARSPSPRASTSGWVSLVPPTISRIVASRQERFTSVSSALCSAA